MTAVLIVLAIIALAILNPYAMIAAVLVAWATPLHFWPCVAVAFAVSIVVSAATS